MYSQNVEFTLKEFLLLQKNPKGDTLTDFHVQDNYFFCNDAVSTDGEATSLASLRIKSPKKSKTNILVDEKSVTLKEIAGQRHKYKVGKKINDGDVNVGSKKIKKDEKVTSASFAKRQHTSKWNFEETRRFYKVL